MNMNSNLTERLSIHYFISNRRTAPRGKQPPKTWFDSELLDT